MRQIVLDTETTGLRHEDGHRIIEIGCVELINRRLTGNHFHRYINPEREVEEGALAVHGISNDFLRDKPVFLQVIKEFVDYIKDAELIIHNAAFDVGFLNHEFALAGKKWGLINDYASITDTLLMARQMHPGQRNSLDALCKRYFVDNTKRDLHGALLDANLLAQVYLAMTGGQGSFFEASNETEASAQGNERVATAISLQGHKLVVISASDAETAAHEDYLALLRKKGRCVWSENDGSSQ